MTKSDIRVVFLETLREFERLQKVASYGVSTTVRLGDSVQLLALPGGPYQVVAEARSYMPAGLLPPGVAIDNCKLDIRSGAGSCSTTVRVDARGRQTVFCPGETLSVAVHWDDLPPMNIGGVGWSPLLLCDIAIWAWKSDAGVSSATYTSTVGGTSLLVGYAQDVRVPAGGKGFRVSASNDPAATSELLLVGSAKAMNDTQDLATWTNVDLLAASIDRTLIVPPSRAEFIRLSVPAPSPMNPFVTLDWEIV